MKIKKERIVAAKKFAEGLDKLFKEFYEHHEPPFFIFIGQNYKDERMLKVFNGVYSVGLIDKKEDLVNLSK